MQIIAKGGPLTIYLDEAGEMHYSFKGMDGDILRVCPENFVELAGPIAEDCALWMHADMIEWGIPEPLVEAFVHRAGFDVTAL